MLFSDFILMLRNGCLILLYFFKFFIIGIISLDGIDRLIFLIVDLVIFIELMLMIFLFIFNKVLLLFSGLMVVFVCRIFVFQLGCLLLFEFIGIVFFVFEMIFCVIEFVNLRFNGFLIVIIGLLDLILFEFLKLVIVLILLFFICKIVRFISWLLLISLVDICELFFRLILIWEVFLMI